MHDTAASPKLTARQQQILSLIQSTIARTGAPPTRAEIAAELGFKSANAAEEHLQALARKGVIELVSGTSRGIRLRRADLQSINDARERQLALPLPGELLDDTRLWAGIPLVHHDRLVGLVLLAAPDFRRPLDWEGFDLLRTAIAFMSEKDP